MEIKKIEALLKLAKRYDLQFIKTKDIECGFWQPKDYKAPVVGIFQSNDGHIQDEQEEFVDET